MLEQYGERALFYWDAPRGPSSEFAEYLARVNQWLDASGWHPVNSRFKPYRQLAMETPVLVAEVAELARKHGWKAPQQFMAMTVGVSGRGAVQSEAEPGSPKPLQRSAAQDAAILAAVRSAGVDPQALPKAPAGKAGVKAQVRAALQGQPLFTGATIFNAAWERLRERRDIRDAD